MLASEEFEYKQLIDIFNNVQDDKTLVGERITRHFINLRMKFIVKITDDLYMKVWPGTISTYV